MDKLVIRHNDGFQQVIPVILRGCEVMAMETCEISLEENNLSFAAGEVITLFDSDSNILLLELEEKIKEGFIIHAAVDVDTMPQTFKKSLSREVVEQIVAEAAAEFWGEDCF